MESKAVSISSIQGIEHLSIVVPVYNEESVLEKFHARLSHVVDHLSYQVTILYVDDGSSDATERVLSRIAGGDQRVTCIELSRNFGHQSALTAGLDYSTGDLVIMMDGDGQHPPELIPQMLDLYRSGHDIVITQRRRDEKISPTKELTSNVFYRLLNWIGDTRILPGSADYRLMSRRALNALRQMREYHRFLRGMIPWMGYKTAVIEYAAPDRLAGESKYSFRKMAKLAAHAIFSFSLVPLHIGLFVGLLFFLLAGAEVVYVLSFWVRGEQDSLAPGWSSLMFMMLITGGIQMIINGFIAVYVGYIFQEVKRRPIYLIKRVFAREKEVIETDWKDEGREGIR